MIEQVRQIKEIVKRGEILYYGWIPGKKSDEAKLYSFGVKPGLQYQKNGNDEYFNMCICDRKTLLKLIKTWPGILACAFTAVDTTTDKQLPSEEQEFWKYE